MPGRQGGEGYTCHEKFRSRAVNLLRMESVLALGEIKKACRVALACKLRLKGKGAMGSKALLPFAHLARSTKLLLCIFYFSDFFFDVDSFYVFTEFVT